VKQIGDEFEKAGPALAGTAPHASVAIIQSYDSRWAIDFQRHSAKFDPVAELIAFYRPLRDQTQAVDVISPDAPLDGYKLVVAPALNVLPQYLADQLIAYVKAGGHLVLGPRSGMKDDYNALNPQRQPGPLVDLLGANVSQFYAIDTDVPVNGDLGNGTANVWAETLAPSSSDTHVLLKYGPSNGWLDNQPAVITRTVEKGSITYIAAWLDQPLLNSISASFVKNAGVQPILPGVPDGVEVCQRSSGTKSVLILINHTTTSQHITLSAAMTDLLTAGSPKINSVELPKYGVAVLQN
jgi:beta-galactosidase